MLRRRLRAGRSRGGGGRSWRGGPLGLACCCASLEGGTESASYEGGASVGSPDFSEAAIFGVKVDVGVDARLDVVGSRRRADRGGRSHV